MAPGINNFNLSSVTNSSGNKLASLMEFTSNPTCTNLGGCQTTVYNYLPGILILLLLGLIIFFTLKVKQVSTTAAFAATVISNFVLAILLYPLGIISGQILVISLILVPLSGGALMFFNR